MLQPHYFIIGVFRPGGDFKAIGQTLTLDHQGMVADGGEGIWNAGEHAFVAVMYQR